MKKIALLLCLITFVGNNLLGQSEKQKEVLEKSREYRRQESHAQETLARWCFENNLIKTGTEHVSLAVKVWNNNESAQGLLQSKANASAEYVIPSLDVQKEYIEKCMLMGEKQALRWAKVVGWAKRYELGKLEEESRSKFYFYLAQCVGVIFLDPDSSYSEVSLKNFRENFKQLEMALRIIDKAMRIGYEPKQKLVFEIVSGEVVGGKFVYTPGKRIDVVEVFLGNWEKKEGDDLSNLTATMVKTMVAYEKGIKNWQALPFWFKESLPLYVAGKSVEFIREGCRDYQDNLSELFNGLEHETDAASKFETQVEGLLMLEYMNKTWGTGKFKEFLKTIGTNSLSIDKTMKKLNLGPLKKLEKSFSKDWPTFVKKFK